MIKELTTRVSLAVVDSWKVMPPCEYNEPFCHPQCPYLRDCWGDDED